MLPTLCYPADSTLAKYAQFHDIEAAVKLVDAALAAGYLISVNDGEEWTLRRSADRDAILRALATTDMDFVRLHNPERPGVNLGTMTLVWGNGPGELIADWSMPNGEEELTRFIEELGFDAMT